MSYLAGVVLDVSSSMQKHFEGGSCVVCGPLHLSLGPLSLAIYKLMYDITTQDVSTDVDVFAIGFGAKHEPKVFDILQSIHTVQDAIRKGKKGEHLRLENINDRSIYSGREALKCVNEWLWITPTMEEIVFEHMINSIQWSRNNNLSSLMLFGSSSPLSNAVSKAANLFAVSYAKKKILFIVSDGYNTDAHDSYPSSELEQKNVTVVSLCVSMTPGDAPKELLEIEDDRWDEGAKNLFRISSSVLTQPLARAMLIKNGWTISSSKTKLFLQVSDEKHLEAATNLVRIVFCFQDALMELLQWISLDMYINRFKPNKQKGGTCYANAAAAVLHFAMKRVIGRKDCKEFTELRDDLVDRFGEDGACTFKVLKAVCPLYRLNCEKVDVAGAMEAITAKRPVLARFYLTKKEWTLFTEFFEKNGKGILTKENLDISLRSSDEELEGHAVVLTSFDSRCFRLMNSWGENWADMGFFRVKTADVLNFEFIDVYWRLNDLTEEEKSCYNLSCAQAEQEYNDKLNRVKKETYKCRKCNKESLVTKFACSVSSAKCPLCHERFSLGNGSDTELFMNRYLIWLAR